MFLQDKSVSCALSASVPYTPRVQSCQGSPPVVPLCRYNTHLPFPRLCQRLPSSSENILLWLRRCTALTTKQSAFAVLQKYKLAARHIIQQKALQCSCKQEEARVNKERPDRQGAADTRGAVQHCSGACTASTGKEQTKPVPPSDTRSKGPECSERLSCALCTEMPICPEGRMCFTALDGVFL